MSPNKIYREKYNERKWKKKIDWLRRERNTHRKGRERERVEKKRENEGEEEGKKEKGIAFIYDYLD